MAKIVITIEKRGRIECTAQRSSDIDRRTYLELLKKLRKGDFLDELEKLAKTIPVKERDTYEDNNRDRSN